MIMKLVNLGFCSIILQDLIFLLLFKVLSLLEMYFDGAIIMVFSIIFCYYAGLWLSCSITIFYLNMSFS